jgi:dCTP deaminase
MKIEPFDTSSLGACSYDLTLGEEFAFPNNKTINLNSETDYKNYFKTKILSEVKLKPNDFILAITQEKITLSNNFAGFLSGRSRFARLGLQVHSSSNFVHPGVSNKQVFEIKNVGKNALILKPGLKIGQIIFFEVKGKSDYEGLFKNQDKII